MSELLMSGAVSQYDRLVHVRPISDLRRVALVQHTMAVYPRTPVAPLSPTLGSGERPKARAAGRDVLGCTGTSWHAMLRLEFATAESGDSVAELDRTGWNVWFATMASAHECVEALNALTKSAGVADVDFCET
ncbi:hypothetical protein GGH91_002427 [Coemansia sp. RSA 2671]|nr:hypothetical protein GGH91_002427 [Coemansia sp. RSA 2671]